MSNLIRLSLVIYCDPGHGWLAVKREALQALGIERKITPYSYQRGGTVYLEEDCDLSTFHHAAKAAGWEVAYTERHTDKRSPIRAYERFTPSA